MEHVKGKEKGKIILYALSTCIWCKKTKELLKELGVEYYFVDVDLLDKQERDEALRVIKKFNPDSGFPTIIINDEDCIIGFNEPKIRSTVEEK